MARVYLASDQVLERQAAVKVLSLPYTQDPSFGVAAMAMQTALVQMRKVIAGRMGRAPGPLRFTAPCRPRSHHERGSGLGQPADVSRAGPSTVRRYILLT